MTDVLTQVLADLEAEGDRLEQLVAGLDEDGWRTPTPAPGWDVATQVAHLTWTDDVAVKAATDKEAWDEVVLGAMPGRLYKVFEHYKRDEWERYLAAVTDWEQEEYLEVLP